jgi:hypothetical protein
MFRGEGTNYRTIGRPAASRLHTSRLRRNVYVYMSQLSHLLNQLHLVQRPRSSEEIIIYSLEPCFHRHPRRSRRGAKFFRYLVQALFKPDKSLVLECD